MAYLDAMDLLCNHIKINMQYLVAKLQDGVGGYKEKNSFFVKSLTKIPGGGGARTPFPAL